MFDNWDQVHEDIKRILYIKGGNILLEKLNHHGIIYDRVIIPQNDVKLLIPKLPEGTILYREASSV